MTRPAVLISVSIPMCPTRHRVPSTSRSGMYGLTSCFTGTVSTIKSREASAVFIAFSSSDTMNSSAPRELASSCLSLDRLSTVTRAPIAAASLTAMCPRPPMPMIPTRDPGPTLYLRSGE
eukprot:gene3147-biopygen3087